VAAEIATTAKIAVRMGLVMITGICSNLPQGGVRSPTGTFLAARQEVGLAGKVAANGGDWQMRILDPATAGKLTQPRPRDTLPA
jgi:hypothetical protein